MKKGIRKILKEFKNGNENLRDSVDKIHQLFEDASSGSKFGKIKETQDEVPCSLCVYKDNHASEPECTFCMENLSHESYFESKNDK